MRKGVRARRHYFRRLFCQLFSYCGDGHITSILSCFLFVTSTKGIASVVWNAGVISGGRFVILRRVAELYGSNGLFQFSKLSLDIADLSFGWSCPFCFVFLSGIHDSLLVRI